jgi:hypothetical protein
MISIDRTHGNFLQRVVDRAFGRVDAPEPRLPSLFEPATWSRSVGSLSQRGLSEDDEVDISTQWTIADRQEADTPNDRRAQHDGATRVMMAVPQAGSDRLLVTERSDEHQPLAPRNGDTTQTRFTESARDGMLTGVSTILPEAAALYGDRNEHRSEIRRSTQPFGAPSVPPRLDPSSRRSEAEQDVVHADRPAPREAAGHGIAAAIDARPSGALIAQAPRMATAPVMNVRRQRSPMEGVSESTKQPSVIHVTIGRVEVRAVSASRPARVSQPRSPKLTLEDYLRSRGGGK